MEICLIDNTQHDTIYDLHAYIRKLKVKQKDYYEKYVPKFDKQTGEKIPFKDFKSYQIVDFLNKNNLNKWVKENPEESIIWLKKYLSARKKEKNLKFAPHHVELRTLFCPSVKTIERGFDYKEICSSIGLVCEFDYKQEIQIDDLPSDAYIIQDTREQCPIKFPKSVIQTLNHGDYTLCEKYNNGVYIERKSISDAVSTLSGGFSRFYREITRAKEANHYMVVLVEVDFNTFNSFDRDYRMRYTKVSPSHVFKNMRDLLHDFDNLQFLFVDGRVNAAKWIIKILSLGQRVRGIDLQYYLDTKKL